MLAQDERGQGEPPPWHSEVVASRGQHHGEGGTCSSLGALQASEVLSRASAVLSRASTGARVRCPRLYTIAYTLGVQLPHRPRGFFRTVYVRYVVSLITNII